LKHVISESKISNILLGIMMQQLAPPTANGCNINGRPEVMASGTISGKDETSFGSLLENFIWGW